MESFALVSDRLPAFLFSNSPAAAETGGRENLTGEKRVQSSVSTGELESLERIAADGKLNVGLGEKELADGVMNLW